MKRITAFLYRLIEPRSKTEDSRRREFVFNVILSGIIIFLIFANIVTISESISLGSVYKGLSPIASIIILAIFAGFYYLSRRGFFEISSYSLIAILFLLASFMGYKWGVDLHASILFYALVIVMAGILINKRFIFIATLASVMVIILTGYLQGANILPANRYWTSAMWGIPEILAAVIIFFVIATITWLSNHEMEKSLARLRKSEIELKEERDSLEIKVEQRTKELKEAQAEKMTQLYRFAEFGRISSGLFHDLMNPLNAVSLNLVKVNEVENHPRVSETKQYVDNAVHAAKRLEDLVIAVRKQLRREETNALFLLDEEIRHVIEVLSHKAQKANVQLNFLPITENTNFQIVGDAVKFNQIVLNLLANGIDACSDTPDESGEKWVRISLMGSPQTIVMLVEDNGSGIPDHHMDKIFEPFFTTKMNGQGLGIGLSMTKRIVEKDFGGVLTAKSEIGKGSSFKVRLPVRNRIMEYAAQPIHQ